MKKRSTAAEHIKLAHELIMDLRVTDALHEFQAAYALEPWNSKAACLLGVALCSLGRWREAETMLVNSQELDGMAWDSLVKAMETQKKYRQLKSHCRERIKKYPDINWYSITLARLRKSEKCRKGVL